MNAPLRSAIKGVRQRNGIITPFVSRTPMQTTKAERIAATETHPTASLSPHTSSGAPFRVPAKGPGAASPVPSPARQGRSGSRRTCRRPVSCRLAAAASFPLFAAMAAAALPETTATNMTGVTPRHAAEQRALEKEFDAELRPSDQRAWLERMSSEPNHVGSSHDRANAEFLLEQFRDWGWEAHIETFQVLYPTPKTLALELVAPTRFVARLREPPVDGDRTSDKTADALPPYHAYGADGDVTAELVYANQGMPEDYKTLERHGVRVQGRIVIARYGGGWRGLKPKLAHEHGAVGCLIYSDPLDDGYGAGDVYPKGGYRPPDGVQRGSVADIPVYPGDPLTPGIGATPEARRLSVQDAKTVLKIPVLPLSYADAQPLLAALARPAAPARWC